MSQILVAIQSAIELIGDLFLDGFLALMALAVVAPLLGVFLVLQRLPLLGLAVPQMAACGQAAAFFVYGAMAKLGGELAYATADLASGELAEPDRWVQVIGSLAGIIVGLGVLLAVGRDRRFLGVHAGILYLVALGLRDIFYLESPYQQIFEESIQHGRLLTVLASGRNQVLLATSALGVVTVLAYRAMWQAAFDPEQMRLNGGHPRRWFALMLGLIGFLCALCVPVVGPEAVLALLLVPSAVLRSAAPSVRLFGWLSVFAGVLGSAAAFVLACTEQLDWPVTPVLVLSVLAASIGVRLALTSARWLVRRSAT